MSANLERSYELAADLVKSADAFIIAAGAGMGVDSGLPDFRGADGFWRAYPALAEAQISFSEIASPRAFDEDPTLAWGFYGHRLNLYRKTVPHQGFSLLRKWAKTVQLGAWIFTSNVDGQFQRAGFLENQVHECHGSIHQLQCMKNCESGIWSSDAFFPEVDERKCRLMNEPPRCPVCGGLARPNIVMFGDWGWRGEARDKQISREEIWLAKVFRANVNVLVIEMGAGTAIPSVRNFSHKASKNFGARIIRINPRESAVPSAKDVGIPTGSYEALAAIDARL